MSLLRQYRYFLIFSLSVVLSGIGSTLTGVAVYDLMKHAALPASAFTAVWVLSFLPALIFSEWGRRLAARGNVKRPFVITTAIGVSVCALNLWNLNASASWVFFLSVFAGGAMNGIIFPVYQTTLKRNVQPHHMGAFSAYETVVFAAQFIAGELLGSIVISMVNPGVYFLIDLATFVLCFVAVMAVAGRLGGDASGAVPGDGRPTGGLLALKWNPKRLDAFLTNIYLALICAPLMSIAAGQMAGLADVRWLGMALNPVLLLLAARSSGQLLGPFVASAIGVEQTARSRWVLPLALAGFFVCYLLAFSEMPVLWRLACVFLAHVQSNIVFTVGFYRLNSEFSTSEFPTVSARHYQFMTGAMVFSGAWAAGLQTVFSDSSASARPVIAGVVVVAAGVVVARRIVVQRLRTLGGESVVAAREGSGV